MHCELCGGDQFKDYLMSGDRLGCVEDEFRIVECVACSLRMTAPEMTQDELSRFYPEEYWGERALPRREWILSSQAEKVNFLECYRQSGRLLDVGCGAGFFLAALDKQRWDVVGLDFSSESIGAANRLLEAERAFVGSLMDSHLAPESFDVITFWSSLEHLSHPRKHLDAAWRLLKPDGLLIVQAPNIASWQARTFGADWFALDLPRHRSHFSPLTLAGMLSVARFKVIDQRFYSETHSAHALKESMKNRFARRRGALGKVLFYGVKPLYRPAEFLIGQSDKGATITVAAMPVGTGCPTLTAQWPARY